MLLRRHKINAVRDGEKKPEKEKVQQEELYGDELGYEPEKEKFSGSFTKTSINRMPVAELRNMAKNTGVEGWETMTGQELKEYLINAMGL